MLHWHANVDQNIAAIFILQDLGNHLPCVQVAGSVIELFIEKTLMNVRVCFEEVIQAAISRHFKLGTYSNSCPFCLGLPDAVEDSLKIPFKVQRPCTTIRYVLMRRAELLAYIG